MNRIYIAGGMTGMPDLNFPAFFEAERQLELEGWDVINPASHDLQEGTVVIGPNGYEATPKFDLSEALRWDLDQITRCDAIYMLDGWEDSKGANAEIALARALGLEIIYESGPSGKKPDYGYTVYAVGEDYENGVEATRYIEKISTAKPRVQKPAVVREPDLRNSGETRVTSTTGGEKGQKIAQLSAIDPGALLTLAKVAGFGAKKYDRLNYMKGFDWSLAYDALFRHSLSALNGEDLDPESGLPHLAHAAWQCLCLLTFYQRGLGTDDRYKIPD